MTRPFDGLTHMRVEILIDPDTMDYQVDIEGTHSVILAALKKIIRDLENPDVIDELTINPN